jgi:DNA polymerase III delta subunit
MITWLVGENSFEIREAIKALEADFNGTAERFDGSELSLAQLPDLLMGVSLFSTERLIVISDISQNSILWE